MPTPSDLIAELSRVQANVGKAFPDMRRTAAIIQEIGPDAVCNETGMTPLQWAIVNDSKLAMLFLLTQRADPNARGTGTFDRAPIEMLVEKGDVEGADRLVNHGAACPPEVKALRERQAELRARHAKALTDIPKRLEKALKSDAFIAAVASFEAAFGVKAAKVRGRKGHLTFKAVPINALAKAEGLEPELWLAKHQAEAADAGVSLFARSLPGERAKDEINIAPSTAKRDVICISGLLPPETGASPYEKLAMADVLDAIDADNPFRLLAAGPLGVLGILSSQPNDPQDFARRLIGVCGELHTDYQI
ncbi:MAG: hypothetical protein KDJ36_12085, partial [Hyphomicrobiaceae bacterium]|nr:hypothetical protein [Hyphomicrobiaceae bacterium]